MNCLKCGREVEENQVFCANCLLDMENHPVKPGTVVLLPRRREVTGTKKIHPRRRAPLSLEDQIKQLKIRIRVLSILLAIMIAVSVFFGWFAVQHFMESNTFLPGQNYSSVGTVDPSETS